MINKEAAKSFSIGEFEAGMPLLAENCRWHLYEDQKVLSGKIEIEAFVKNIAAYFSSVDKEFRISCAIEEENVVAVNGSAKFYRNGKLINEVESCD